MAKKQNTKNETVVTRISASDSPSKQKPAKPAKAAAPKKSRGSKESTENSRSFFGYFKGAWYELRQVRWPNRGATWSLTGAVLAFSAFFVVLILLLDALFKYIFETILG